MKKIFESIGFLTLILFTFVYTNKITTTIKENDDILEQIKSIEDQYKTEPIDAIINENTIITGVSGSQIDIQESYKKMKKTNQFNTNLLVYEKIKPTISVKNNYDKYIIKSSKNAVSLIFLVEQHNDINKVLTILNKYGIKANFFTDGNWFEDNNNKVISLIEEGHIVGNLGYNYDYKVNGVSWMNTIVTKIGNQNDSYCYVEEENEEALNICKQNKSYTIMPNIIVKNNPLITIKQNLINGSIISLKINDNVINELPLIIEYINSKDLNIVNIEELLDE